MQQIRPIFVQSAFRIAPMSLRTTLEHISDQITKFTKIDPMAGDAFDQPKLKSRLTSTEHWTTLLLDLFHSPPEQTSNKQYECSNELQQNAGMEIRM